MKVTLKDIERYVYAEENEDELSEKIMNFVPKTIGPILVKEGLIEEDNIQTWKEKPDWIATVNDVVCFTSKKEKKQWMKIFKEYDNRK